MTVGIVILAFVVAVIALSLVWYWGYSIGQRDAYMDYFEKKEYYDWIMEVQRKQNWE